MHSDEELRAYAYAALRATQKLAWLHTMWQFNVDFFTPEARELHEAFRKGEISGGRQPARGSGPAPGHAPG